MTGLFNSFEIALPMIGSRLVVFPRILARHRRRAPV
jgi:hypothetical protein